MARRRTKANAPADDTATLDEAELVPPDVLELAERLEAGEAAIAEESAATPEDWHFETIPQELEPYVRSRSLTALEAILRQHYYLYWHPIVRYQVLFLRTLTRDPSEWTARRWAPAHGCAWPEEIGKVYEWERRIVAAHARGLSPRHRLRWQPPKGKRRAAAIANPYPNDESAAKISIRDLCDDFGYLRDEFEKHGDALPRFRGDASTILSRLAPLVEQALYAEGPDWTSLQSIERANELPDRSAAPRKPHRVPGGALVWDMPVIHQSLERELNAFAKRSPARRGELLKKHGRPGTCALFTLAALLNERAWIIGSKLDNYRYPRKRS